jgi:hypothetical protein
MSPRNGMLRSELSVHARELSLPDQRTVTSAGIVTTETTQKLENKAENKNCRMRADPPVFEPPARL